MNIFLKKEQMKFDTKTECVLDLYGRLIEKVQVELIGTKKKKKKKKRERERERKEAKAGEKIGYEKCV